ncbi:MAG: hypothetical protein JSV54_04085 [Chloroflexota bacterium]|nr:MAG: hypothetical protein JSV54_04085 [Chloroflexota bacterium]
MKNIFSYVALICILTAVLMISSCTESPPSPLPPSEAPPTTTSQEPETEPAPPPPPAPTFEKRRVEETDPSFKFDEGWRKDKDERASGGSWAMTFRGYGGIAVPTVDIKFKGTGISLVHVTAPFCGITDIKIDGKDYPSIDSYAANPQNKITSIATDLTYDDHILTISPSGGSNPAADVTSAGPEPPPTPIIYVDAVEIIVPK